VDGVRLELQEAADERYVYERGGLDRYRGARPRARPKVLPMSRAGMNCHPCDRNRPKSSGVPNGYRILPDRATATDCGRINGARIHFRRHGLANRVRASPRGAAAAESSFSPHHPRISTAAPEEAAYMARPHLSFLPNLKTIEREYKAGDLTALYLALGVLYERRDIPNWLWIALMNAVDQLLRQRKLNRKMDQLSDLRARAEHLGRYLMVERCLKDGMAPNAAYQAVRDERERITGISVTPGAIRQSYRRLARQKRTLGSLVRMGALEGEKYALSVLRTKSRVIGTRK